MSKPLVIAPNIALAQLNPMLGALDHNLEKILESWSDMDGKADLVIYPEMIVCGYPPEDLVLKPFFLDSVENHVHALVEKSRNFSSAALISTPWRIGDKTYNAALLIENGEIRATRTKHHLPNYGVFDEQRVFASGPLEQDPIDFKGTHLGLLICEDMWHADVAQHLKTQGADILIAPNGSPFTLHKKALRLGHTSARVRETGLPLLYVNQIGGQDELVFDGASFVMDAEGHIVDEWPEFEESVKIIEWGEGKTTSAASPASPDSLYAALMLGLCDYVRKNGFPGVLIGLSGGIDSALSAILAVDALGPEKVHCVMMPSRFTSKESLQDAEELAKSLGVKLDNISISSAVTAFNDVLTPHFDESTPAVTFENIQPRARGLILMALSNATGAMVLSTGNKSEMAVGYATLYGDMCGGFNALKDLYKTQVYALSDWRNDNTPRSSLTPEGAAIPQNIITKAPTAELKDNQTDQDTLPPYAELDDILHGLIEQDLSVKEIEKRGHDEDTIKRVWRMLDRAEYKRRQAPPGVKITSRAFGRDRRYPITNHFLNIIEKT